MPVAVADDPADRPAWILETVALLTQSAAAGRGRLLAAVASAPDADLVAGTDDAWGLGQIATHLLVSERGIAGIALRLARGEAVAASGQPRPGPAGISREGIAVLADKAELAVARLRGEFPAAPDVRATARHPYYGDLNAFGWLLTLPNHYLAHLEAFGRGLPSAL